MKIKILDPNLTVTLQEPKIVLKSGVVYDLDKATAKRLIESNMAVAVEGDEKEADGT